MASDTLDRFAGISGNLGTKAPVLCATVGPIMLAGLQAIDNLMLLEGTAVLVKDQNNPADNGIYLASSSAWVRRTDFDNTDDFVRGTLVYVAAGTRNARTLYSVSSSSPTSVGSSPITFDAIVGDGNDGSTPTEPTDPTDPTEPGLGVLSGVRLDFYRVDGQPDWNAALLVAAAALGPMGGRVFLGNETEYVFDNPTIPQGVTLYGRYELPPFPGTNQDLDLEGSVQWVRLAGGTITLSAGAGLKGVAIAPEGMPLPQTSSSAWAGTAITIGGDSTLIENVLVAGFGQAHSSVGHARGTIRNFYFDCNNGLFFQNSYDTTRCSGLHGWCFATIKAYAASYNKLPPGDPNRTVDGYDARINLRSGIGLKFRNSNDDTHIDDAILVGFMTGLDLESTGGIHFGRIWTECYGRSGSIGWRCGKNVDNIYCEDYQAWSSAGPLVLDMNATERVAFGHIRFVNPLFAPCTIYGGNLTFNVMECRGTPAGASCINIVNGDGRSTVSQVSGVLIDDTFNTNTPPVQVPTNFIISNLDGLHIESPYRPDGTALIGGSISFPRYLTAAQTVLLPPKGRSFKMQGTATIETLGGGHAGREVTLLFRDSATLKYTGAAGGGIAGSVTGVATRVFPAGGIWRGYYDAEYGSWREMVFVDFTGGGGSGGGGGPIPGPRLLGNKGTTSAAPVPLTLTEALDIIVNTSGAMIGRHPTLGWAAVGPGGPGKFLMSKGAADVPEFVDLPAGSGGGTTTPLPNLPPTSVLGNNTAGTQQATAVSMGGMMDNVGGAVGSLTVKKGFANWGPIDAGPAGYVLTSNGNGQVPGYAPPPSSGGGSTVSACRMTLIGDRTASQSYGDNPNGVAEFYGSCAVSALGGTGNGVFWTARYRQLQYQVNGSWLTFTSN